MDTYYRWRTAISIDQGLALVTTTFGWEFETLRYRINQTLCEALRHIGRSLGALDAVENMGKRLKEDERQRCKGWSAGFKHDCVTEWSARGDQALKADHYDAAIEQYSGSIALDPLNYNLYSNPNLTYASKQLWKEAPDDAEQLDTSHAPAYQRHYCTLLGAERYDEAIVAHRSFVRKANPNSNNQYTSPDDTEAKIKAVAIDVVKNMPTRLFNIASGILCNHGDILRRFQASDPYKLVSSITTREDLDIGDSIADLVSS